MHSMNIFSLLTACNNGGSYRRMAIMVLFMLPTVIYAQWRVGVTSGITYNHYTSNEYYLTNFHNEGKWGLSAGIVGQYDICKWAWGNSKLGVRAELNWMEKNHSQKCEIYDDHYLLHYEERNHYIQAPIMATYSLGGKKLRAFANMGAYCGFWLYSEGHLAWTPNGKDISPNYLKRDFNSQRDQRFDAGFVGGIGIEWTPCKRIALQLETREYFSLVSTQKDYMTSIKAPRYNRPLIFQATVFYLF